MLEDTEEDALFSQSDGYGTAPCPFRHDGTEVFVDNPRPEWGTEDFYVECCECGCRGPLRATKAEAVAAWNSRP